MNLTNDIVKKFRLYIAIEKISLNHYRVSCSRLCMSLNKDGAYEQGVRHGLSAFLLRVRCMGKALSIDLYGISNHQKIKTERICSVCVSGGLLYRRPAQGEL